MTSELVGYYLEYLYLSLIPDCWRPYEAYLAHTSNQGSDWSQVAGHCLALEQLATRDQFWLYKRGVVKHPKHNQKLSQLIKVEAN